MSENERLREALGRIVEETDDAVTKPREWMKETFVAIYSIATEALASKPDVCVWHTETIDGSPRWFSDCGLRNVGLNEFDPPSWDTPHCPGPCCGRKIEVRE